MTTHSHCAWTNEGGHVKGTVLLIWPDGVIYGGVTAERIERILREHLIG